MAAADRRLEAAGVVRAAHSAVAVVVVKAARLVGVEAAVRVVLSAAVISAAPRAHRGLLVASRRDPTAVRRGVLARVRPQVDPSKETVRSAARPRAALRDRGHLAFNRASHSTAASHPVRFNGRKATMSIAEPFSEVLIGGPAIRGSLAGGSSRAVRIVPAANRPTGDRPIGANMLPADRQMRMFAASSKCGVTAHRIGRTANLEVRI
jgi:hypothetical protein